MKLKTYQAYTMAQALAVVKRDLGHSAVILHTRTFKRGGFLGLGRKTIVEVTATVGEDAKTRPEPEPSSSESVSNSVSPAAVGARRAYGTNQPADHIAPERSAKPQPDEPQPVTEEDRQRTRQLARKLAEQYERRGRAEPEAASAEGDGEPFGDESFSSIPSPADTTETADRSVAASKPPQPESAPAGHPRRFILTPERDEHDGATDDDATSAGRNAAGVERNADPAGHYARDDSLTPGRPVPVRRQPAELFAEAATGKGGRSNDDRAMQEELAAIRDMVGQVLQRQTRGGESGRPSQPDMPQQLFEMYLKLIGQDISEELASRIVNDVRDELTGEELSNEQKLRESMLRHLTDYIPTAQQAVPRYSPDDRPLTIALVGPTGVGKTTTLAKLAASFKLRHNRKVGMITSDTYRIAAVDQLRTYANIIGLPIKIALTPREMEQAVHALSDCDVILIDTAGRGQNDASRLEELRQFIEAAEPHEVHLVLSGTASEKVLLREAEAFSEVGVDKIVLTKLDEAVSFGMLVNVIRQVGKELSFFTTGQEVPDHIEVGKPERLAELILGGKLHT